LLIVVLVMLVAVGAACRGSSTVSLHSETTGSVTWRPCGRVQCASLAVPLDPKKPAGDHIGLALARLPATNKRARRGVLFVNPGGPGGSGVDFLRTSAGVFSPNLRKNFDLVSWDPRGVGASAPIDCGDHLDAFYAVDRDPKTASAQNSVTRATNRFVAACTAKSGASLPFMATVNGARDMDAIRRAMGEATISYFGFSYGTYLGTVYAEMYPKHVRAMVLDGAIDPARSYAQTTVDQARGFEHELDAFFEWCRNHDSCGIAHGSDPRAAYDKLAAAIAAEPVATKVDGEARTLGPGEFDLGVVSILYEGESGFGDLGAALADAARGGGSRLLRASDEYTERNKGGTYSNETAALYATGCLDAPAPKGVAAVDALAAQAARVSPHFGATTTWLGLPCAVWPVRATQPPRALDARGAQPILVVGGKGDPATPYAWAQGLARELSSARLLTYEGDGHTSYARGSACVDGAVDSYLLDLEVPAPETTCSSG
jgi:pimeloyl-ACP methyl ester carboxylesterase